MPRTPGGTTPDGQSIQYAYMFERESEPPVWSPTKQLDALLRAIANYIVGRTTAPWLCPEADPGALDSRMRRQEGRLPHTWQTSCLLQRCWRQL